MGKGEDRRGQVGERGAAQSLQDHYFADDASRAPRKHLHDVEGPETIEGIGCHVEVKVRRNRHAAYAYMDQAADQKLDSEWPLVMLKSPRQPFLYVIREQDILNFVRGYLTNRQRSWDQEPGPESISRAPIASTGKADQSETPSEPGAA